MSFSNLIFFFHLSIVSQLILAQCLAMLFINSLNFTIQPLNDFFQFLNFSKVSVLLANNGVQLFFKFTFPLNWIFLCFIQFLFECINSGNVSFVNFVAAFFMNLNQGPIVMDLLLRQVFFGEKSFDFRHFTAGCVWEPRVNNFLFI
jgi:hypothetical protein